MRARWQGLGATSVLAILVAALTISTGAFAPAGETHYLFSSFRGDGEDGLHLAHSRDGLRWTALNGDRSFLQPSVGTKLMRDPSIVRGPDGIFHADRQGRDQAPVAKKHLRIAVSARAAGPYGSASPAITPDWVEGPSALKLGDTWVVLFDEYTRKRYGGIRSSDLKTWTNISDQVEFPPGARHGTAFAVPVEIAAAPLNLRAR